MLKPLLQRRRTTYPEHLIFDARIFTLASHASGSSSWWDDRAGIQRDHRGHVIMNNVAIRRLLAWTPSGAGAVEAISLGLPEVDDFTTSCG